MPTYEYRCPDGHDFEHFVQKMSQASSELPCPVCGKAAARRMSAGAGLVFKGSGFYITDYGKDGKKDQRDDAEKRKTAADKAEVAAVGDGTKKVEGVKAEPAKSDAVKSDAKRHAAKTDVKKVPVAAPPPKRGGKE